MLALYYNIGIIITSIFFSILLIQYFFYRLDISGNKIESYLDNEGNRQSVYCNRSIAPYMEFDTFLFMYNVNKDCWSIIDCFDETPLVYPICIKDKKAFGICFINFIEYYKYKHWARQEIKRDKKEYYNKIREENIKKFREAQKDTKLNSYNSLQIKDISNFNFKTTLNSPLDLTTIGTIQSGDIFYDTTTNTTIGFIGNQFLQIGTSLTTGGH